MPGWPLVGMAGASGLPFGILRGYVGTDLDEHTLVATGDGLDDP